MLTWSCLTSEPMCLPLCHPGRELGLYSVYLAHSSREYANQDSFKVLIEKVTSGEGLLLIAALVGQSFLVSKVGTTIVGKSVPLLFCGNS